MFFRINHAFSFLALVLSFSLCKVVSAYQAEIRTNRPSPGVSGAAIVLPPPPAGGASGQSGAAKNQIMRNGAVPVSISSAFVVPTDQIPRIIQFSEWSMAAVPKGTSYQNQTPSGRLLVSLKILGHVLKEGPTPEYKILGIVPEQSSTLTNVDQPLTGTAALNNAIADLNSLGLYVQRTLPEKLSRPSDSIKYIREELSFLQKAQVEFGKGH